MVLSLMYESLQQRRCPTHALQDPESITGSRISTQNVLSLVTAAQDDHTVFDSWRPTGIHFPFILTLSAPVAISLYKSPNPSHGFRETLYTPLSLDQLKLYILGEFYLCLSCVPVFSSSESKATGELKGWD